jgi:hypothetical protein
LLIDEFPDAVVSIENDNKNNAIQFLQLNRDLRLNFNSANFNLSIPDQSVWGMLLVN